MTTITSLNRTTASTSTQAVGGNYTSTPGAISTAGNGSSTVVSLGAGANDASGQKALVWENRTRSTSATRCLSRDSGGTATAEPMARAYPWVAAAARSTGRVQRIDSPALSNAALQAARCSA